MKLQHLSSLAIVVTGIAIFSSMADERKPKSNGIDDSVVALLEKHFPGHRITWEKKDREQGEKIQKIRLRGQDKEDVLVILSMAGDILELDEDIGQREVPRHVLAAFRKAFPDAKIRHAEKGTRMEITYRLDIEQNGRKHEVVVSRRGRISEVVSRD